MKNTYTEPLRILIVSKMFPPLRTARSIQIGRVASALNDVGCSIQVVAGLTSDQSKPDNSILDSESFKYQVHFVGYPASAQSGGVSRICSHLMRELESVNTYAPWVTKTVVVSKEVISTFKPHFILTASTPFESHLVGMRLKQETGISWIASLSDPWPRQIQPAPYGTNQVPLLSLWQMRMLRKILLGCDAVHMPSVYGLRAIERHAGVAIAQKGWAIPHIGVPSYCMQTVRMFPWLVHIGQLSRERVSIALLKAIRIVAETQPNIFRGLLCVGTVCPEFERKVRSLGLSTYIKIQQQVDTQKALDFTSKAGALLVVEADMAMSPFLPSKFADYALAGRPILALTPPESQIRDYLRKSPMGLAVAHNTNEIVQALLTIFTISDSKEHGMDVVDQNLAHEFSSQNVGKRYVEMLCACDIKKGPVFQNNHSQPKSIAIPYGSRRTQ